MGLQIGKSLYDIGMENRALLAIEYALSFDPKWPEALTLRDTILEQTAP
jgi:hypothetical protein